MIEHTCTLIAAAIASAGFVALYYRICQPAKFWDFMAAWFHRRSAHAEIEQRVCNFREVLKRQAAANGAAKPASAGKTVSDNGLEYRVEERA